MLKQNKVSGWAPKGYSFGSKVYITDTGSYAVGKLYDIISGGAYVPATMYGVQPEDETDGILDYLGPVIPVASARASWKDRYTQNVNVPTSVSFVVQYGPSQKVARLEIKSSDSGVISFSEATEPELQKHEDFGYLVK